MRFETPFIRLPVQFDAAALEAEVRALPESAWVPHATGFVGNEAVRLVTPGGAATDAFEGPMQPTDNLARCPFITQVMAELGGVWGRSRLMGLGAGAEVPEHVDSHYHWRTHVRIHVPIITNPEVKFTCGEETVHMQAGECWLFDSFRWHQVQNGGGERRVHLVLDTVVSPALWDLIDKARGGSTALRTVEPTGADQIAALKFEQINAPEVMTPWEMRCHIAFLVEQSRPSPKLAPVEQRLDRFADSWAALWAQFGPSRRPEYRQLLGEARADLKAAGADDVLLENELQLSYAVDQLIMVPAIAMRP
jgi:mannose-6-phosphate isomerase-like protein (cupin superfamily)